jgi:predicted DNA-binding transcriptional regulator AlpA
VSKALSVATPPTPQITATTPAKRFLSDTEIEASFGIPRKTLQNWRILGRGPTYRKFGNSVRYDVADLETWIQGLPTGGNGMSSCAVVGER